MIDSRSAFGAGIPEMRCCGLPSASYQEAPYVPFPVPGALHCDSLMKMVSSGLPCRLSLGDQ